MSKLLTRDEFRKAVFERDGHKCVACGDTERTGVKLDAHHIIERRLFPDGGYYLDNGATVCDHTNGGASCHLTAEQTLLSCEELRKLCGITTVVLPEHLYRDQEYDKWGNPVLPNRQRLRGELFDDESVQKALKPVLNLFTNRVKYPRTWHLETSPGATDDDRKIESSDEVFDGHTVVITEKRDGENCTLYSDYIHARSLEYSSHPSRDRVKALWSQIAHDIPDGWRVCGENLYALHSIPYDALTSYLEVFSVWDNHNICLTWDETAYWGELLGLTLVPVVYRGPWVSVEHAHSEWVKYCNSNMITSEGFVVRNDTSFHYKDFKRNVAKWVRPNHVVHHDGHWSNRPVVPNKLK